MKILLTGANGFIGSRLIKSLLQKGYKDIRVLTRNKKNIKLPVEIFEWNPEQLQIEQGALKNIEVIIHLAGESISESRWTKEKKQKLINSRVNGTKLLLKEINKLEWKPKKFISSSAIGFYGNRGDELLNENSKQGKGFLSELCHLWEKLSLNHQIKEMNSCVVRSGIVLESHGGALAKMLPLFTFGLGGPLGNGKQFMSWIHLDDLVNIFIHLLESKSSQGIYNGTSPNPVSNKDFSKTLGKVLKCPSIFPAPAFAIKVILGEMSQIVLDGQRVVPERLQKEDFSFMFENLEDCLNQILK